jgi:hypothetical protein
VFSWACHFRSTHATRSCSPFSDTARVAVPSSRPPLNGPDGIAAVTMGTKGGSTADQETPRRPSCGAVPSWRGGYRPAPARGSGAGARPGPAPSRAGLTGRAEWRVDACGPGRQASPPRRPAAGPAATAPGNGEGVPPVTARDPAPGPAGLPLRQGRAARPYPPRRTARPRRLSSFLVPRAGCPGDRPAVAIPAGAGLDAAGGAERPSSRTHGRAAPGNANRSRPAPRHPGRRPRNPGRPAADDR